MSSINTGYQIYRQKHEGNNVIPVLKNLIGSSADKMQFSCPGIREDSDTRINGFVWRVLQAIHSICCGNLFALRVCSSVTFQAVDIALSKVTVSFIPSSRLILSNSQTVDSQKGRNPVYDQNCPVHVHDKGK